VESLSSIGQAAGPGFGQRAMGNTAAQGRPHPPPRNARTTVPRQPPPRPSAYHGPYCQEIAASQWCDEIELKVNEAKR